MLALLINNKLAGLARSHKLCPSGDGRKTTVIFINNDQLHVTLITQLSNEDCVVAEVRSETVNLHSVITCFDSRKDIEEVIR